MGQSEIAEESVPQLLDRIVALIPCTGITYACHSVVQEHVGQFDAATMEMCVDHAGEQCQTRASNVSPAGGVTLPRGPAETILSASITTIEFSELAGHRGRR